MQSEKSIRLLVDEEKTKTQLARLVRTAREKAGLSQRDLAKSARTTQAVVARLELGTDERFPSLMLICRLLKAAGAHLELRCVFDKAA
jgi:transcriptional regulator with XRE-family HTH domain